MSEEEMLEEEIDERCPECSAFLHECTPLDDLGMPKGKFKYCPECGYGDLY